MRFQTPGTQIIWHDYGKKRRVPIRMRYIDGMITIYCVIENGLLKIAMIEVSAGLIHQKFRYPHLRSFRRSHQEKQQQRTQMHNTMDPVVEILIYHCQNLLVQSRNVNALLMNGTIVVTWWCFPSLVWRERKEEFHKKIRKPLASYASLRARC